MSLSRRNFVQTIGLGGAAATSLPTWMHGRGLEGGRSTSLRPALLDDAERAQDAAIIKLDSNENPNGPVPAAIRAMQQSMRTAALYPDRYEQPLRDAIASANGLQAGQVMIGIGSSETLRLAVQAFCSPTRHLVAPIPTFEPPAEYARLLGCAVREVPLDSRLRIDLDAMLAQVKGAGLVFLCNPNNPTGHVHGAAAVRGFVEAALAADPEVMVVVDEAYHEFVDDPAYASAVPLVATSPRVIVSRTFSKIYGIAGMRLGYAIADRATIRRMDQLRLPSGITALTLAAGLAALGDPAQVRKEQEANRVARAFTMEWFAKAGYDMVPSQANFILVHIKRDPGAFKAACATQGVIVGRVFPRLSAHARISIGTLAEMRRAVPVFQRVLA